jgi:hypothetical protein
MLALGFGLVWPNQARRKILQFLSLSLFWLVMYDPDPYTFLLAAAERKREAADEEA